MPHRSHTSVASSYQDQSDQHYRTGHQEESKSPAPVTSPKIDPHVFKVSVSQLLGFDYIFITGQNVSTYFGKHSTAIATLEEYLELLDINPASSIFISVDEHEAATSEAIVCEENSSEQSPDEHDTEVALDLRFTRHDIEWANERPEKIHSVYIDDAEQQAFMQMIWQGSSPCAV